MTMPATVHQAESPSSVRKDSAFFDEDFALERIRTPSLATTVVMHARTTSLPSVDSGTETDGQDGSALRVHVPMRRVKVCRRVRL